MRQLAGLAAIAAFAGGRLPGIGCEWHRSPKRDGLVSFRYDIGRAVTRRHPLAVAHGSTTEHHDASVSRKTNTADRLNREISQPQRVSRRLHHPCRVPGAGLRVLRAGDERPEPSGKAIPNSHREDRKMKHLLTGVAVVAALAFSAPIGAQPVNPSGGNSMGMPGPNPGGPGLTPYSSAPARPAMAPPPAAPAPAATMPPPSTPPADTSAMPPKHRQARASSHGKMAGHHPGRFPNPQGNSVANQLNQAELARLQSGNFTPPPPPPGPDMAPPAQPGGMNPMNRMPAGGRATSGGTGR